MARLAQPGSSALLAASGGFSSATRLHRDGTRGSNTQRTSSGSKATIGLDRRCNDKETTLAITPRHLENPTRSSAARSSERGDATGASHRHRYRGTATLVLSLLWIVLTACVVAGCGQSAADKAKNQVCSARADIDKQLHYLQGLTLTTYVFRGSAAGLALRAGVTARRRVVRARAGRGGRRSRRG